MNHANTYTPSILVCFYPANPDDVLSAIAARVPAGRVFPTDFLDDPSDDEIRIAFDFDGVLADDSAETIFQQSNMYGFHISEEHNLHIPFPFDPLHRFFVAVENLQKRTGALHKPQIRIAIVTARNAPSHERVVTTLRHWGVEIDEAFFLGGIAPVKKKTS